MKNLEYFKSRKIQISLVLLAAVLLFVFLSYYKDIAAFIRYSFLDKNKMVISLDFVNPQIEKLSAEASNKLYLAARVSGPDGKPVSKARVEFSCSIGQILAFSSRTNDSGELLAVYTPPEVSGGFFPAQDTSAVISASIKGSVNESVKSVGLIPPPVVLIHGYQCTGNIFDNMSDYLSSKGFITYAPDYNSENGIHSGAREISSFLQEKYLELMSEGVQVNKFDIVAHSMGGLVARYYTSSGDYVNYGNVRKLIFLSVPHKGSPVASLGASYFDDAGIRDLLPRSDMLTKVLPSMINKGLNGGIQAGNILGQYDEVVGQESASLEEWGIRTFIFNVGENMISVDNILNGNIFQTANHKNVLNNTAVFEKIEEMLKNPLPYPKVR